MSTMFPQALHAGVVFHATQAVTQSLSLRDAVRVEVQETDYKARLGRVITEVRVLRGVSQADLAQRIGRSEAALSRWENGRAMPSAYDVAQISRVLDAPADLFINPPDVPVSPIELALRRAAAEEAGETRRPRPRRADEEP